MSDHAHEPVLNLGRDRAGTATARLILQAGRSLRLEAPQPEADGGTADVEDGGDFRHGAALGRQQHHLRPLTHPADRLPGQTLEFLVFLEG